MFAVGRLEAHQCRFVREDKGRHVQTEVTQVTRPDGDMVVQ
jgi:hypothetical protein